MKKVFICSPYRGDVHKNKIKALAYCRQAVDMGYIPFAPHLYFTRFMNDRDPSQRAAGIDAGLAWLKECDEVWVYGEPTEGMRIEIGRAGLLGIPVIRKEVIPDTTTTKPTPTTNFERITQNTAALAAYLTGPNGDICDMCVQGAWDNKTMDCTGECLEGVLAWLEREWDCR